MLKLVFERLKLSLLLILRLNLLRDRVEIVWKLTVHSLFILVAFLCVFCSGSSGCARLRSRLNLLSFLVVVIHSLRLGFVNFVLCLFLDFLQLLHRRLVVVRQDHQILSLLLEPLGVIVGFLLEAHGLSLVQAEASFFELSIWMVICHLLFLASSALKLWNGLSNSLLLEAQLRSIN